MNRACLWIYQCWYSSGLIAQFGWCTHQKRPFFICAPVSSIFPCLAAAGSARLLLRRAALTSVASVEECDDSCLHHSDNTYPETICSTLTLVVRLYPYWRCFSMFAGLIAKHKKIWVIKRGTTGMCISWRVICASHKCKRSWPCMDHYKCRTFREQKKNTMCFQCLITRPDAGAAASLLTFTVLISRLKDADFFVT